MTRSSVLASMEGVGVEAGKAESDGMHCMGVCDERVARRIYPLLLRLMYFAFHTSIKDRQQRPRIL